MVYTPNWQAGLISASWRGIPFHTKEVTIEKSRKNAIHQYPYSDKIFVEDLGRGIQRVSFDGFLLGEFVYIERDAFAAALDQSGTGLLIHPSIGALNASIETLSLSESYEHGGLIKMRLSFIVTSDVSFFNLFPSSLTNTISSVLSDVTGLNAAATSDFFTNIGTDLTNGVKEVSSVVETAASFGEGILSAVNSASQVVNAVKGISGLFRGSNAGRYNLGNISSIPAIFQTVQTGVSNIAILGSATTAAIGAASQARSLVSSGISDVEKLGNLL